jgi:DNA-binding LytR/AlgR family response regulator
VLDIPFLVAVQKESEVFVRIEDISLLEAHQNFTIAHFPNGEVLIQRSLADCERRLDSSMFFRASRDCIVNLSQVKQSRLSKDRGLIFLLKDGKEVVLSRRQTALFRHEVCELHFGTECQCSQLPARARSGKQYHHNLTPRQPIFAF